MFRTWKLAAALLAAVVLVACSQPIAVSTIQIGRSLNVDQSVASQTTTFKPNETVYVSALNSARGEGTISVRWYMGAQLLSEREKRVSFKGAGATEFNISSATGFPIGDYSVEVFVNGASIGSRKFNVSK
jgi:TRAP-type C4-dicarboxylate transport system substrate-binding protein